MNGNMFSGLGNIQQGEQPVKEELYLSVVSELQTQNGKPAGDSHGNKYLRSEHKVPVRGIAEAVEIRGRVTAALNPVKPITEPLTAKDVDENFNIEGVVRFGLDELFGLSEKKFLKAVSEKLVGNNDLADFNVSVVGGQHGEVWFKVYGCAASCFKYPPEMLERFQ